MTSMPDKIKFRAREIEAYDIKAMFQMTDEQYRSYVESDQLMYVDHDNNLRSFIADYPIATTWQQLDILIAQLQYLRTKMVSAEN